MRQREYIKFGYRCTHAPTWRVQCRPWSDPFQLSSCGEYLLYSKNVPMTGLKSWPGGFVSIGCPSAKTNIHPPPSAPGGGTLKAFFFYFTSRHRLPFFQFDSAGPILYAAPSASLFDHGRRARPGQNPLGVYFSFPLSLRNFKTMSTLANFGSFHCHAPAWALFRGAAVSQKLS